MLFSIIQTSINYSQTYRGTMKRFLFLGFLFFSATVFAFETHSRVDLSTVEQILLPNSTITVNITFHLDKNWHTYAPKSEIGHEPRFTWTLPEGVSVGEFEWPSFKVFNNQGLTYQGYDEGFTLNIPLKLDAKKRKSMAVSVDVYWLVCADVCIPHETSLQLNIGRSSSVFIVLVFAFIGGLLLNLMPCVFPVIALKVYELVRLVDSTKSRLLPSIMLYTLGIVGTFLILGGLLSVFKLIGIQVGWGFQLQSPYFLSFLILLFLGMGFYFLGVFNWGYQATTIQFKSNNRYLQSLLWGVTAVLVATPCSAPFMGTAIGATLGMSIPFILIVFGVMGIGMGFPYLLFAFFPRLLNLLPKPGKWMVTFKKVLSIPLFLTVIWLATLLFAVLTPVSMETTSNYSWDQATYAQLLKTNQPLLLKFTAKWCLTCELNERLFFKNEAVQQFLKKKNITVITVDWTHYDADITRLIQSFGRNSIPLYVLHNYPLVGSQTILPELLTPSTIQKW